MELLMEFVEGFGLIETVVTAFLAFLGYVAQKVFPFVRESLKSVKQETNSGIIAWLAEEAVSLMDERFKGKAGNKKFEEATNWLSNRAKEYEINLSHQEIAGAVQKGFDMTIGQEKKEKSKDLPEEHPEE